jgi:hypothetical protein
MRGTLADLDAVPAIDSPVDAVDAALTAGGAFGLLTYVSGLLTGNVDVATLGVVVGVVCVLCTLLIRSLRGLVAATYPGADWTST